MADSSSKFASVNPRKSYGQQQGLSHGNYQPFNANYGQAGRGRIGSGSGSGGGMVVLSRGKTFQKASGAKLSVPPPLNLPSLRKEHAKSDVLGSGGGGGSGAGSSRPTSSGVGWSKPAPVPLQDKDLSVQGNLVEHVVDSDVDRKYGSYLQSSARPTAPVGPASSSARAFPSSVEKASVLLREDFPSLQAALPVPSGTGQKQKDGFIRRQRQMVGEEPSYVSRDGSGTSALVEMPSQSRQAAGNGLLENSTETHGLRKPVIDHSRKPEEYFPGPSPLVRLNPRSDWADDERDTGHGLPDRARNISSPIGDDYWDRDFTIPRASNLPSKPVYKQYARNEPRDNESGRGFSSAVLKVDPDNRNVRIPSREGRENNNWRSTSFLKGQEVDSDRNGSVKARGSGLIKDTWKDTRYTPSRAADTDQYSGIGGTKDSTFVRSRMPGTFNGQGEQNTHDRYGIEQSSRYRRDTSLNTNKSSFTSGGKMYSRPDPKHGKSAFSKSERVPEVSFHKDFDSLAFDDMDPFYLGWPGVIKRKKDMKPTDFVDPARESFEAELERVQRMQELERQRLVVEQERAMEETQREEEERQKLVRQEEERQQRFEEDAREAEWRAEQERLEEIDRAEEQRISREAEKRRMFMEEERRKLAAKQKLMELEAKMAKKQTVSLKADSSSDIATIGEKLPSLVTEKDNLSTVDFDNWEESERMVERITTLASVESSSSSNRDFEMNMKPNFSREGSSNIPDRRKSINSWRSNVFGNENGSSSSLPEQEISHFSPRGDTLIGGRVVPRKDFNGGAQSRGYSRGDMQEQYMDEFGHQRDQRWNFPGNADVYHKNPQLSYECYDNFAEKYGDGWAQGRYQGNHRHVYPNTESDELYSYGRSRDAMRQPRVLPPPSLATAHRSPFGGRDEHPGSSTLLDNSHYHHGTRSETFRQTGYYGSYEDGLKTSDPHVVHQENSDSENQRRNEVTPRCDSQSSLSVTSPPNSPPHLSHDELDESGSSLVISAGGHEGKVLITRNESSDTTNARIDDMVNVPSCTSVEVDSWTVENRDTLLQQEEYDEQEDGYQEEYEVREGGDENLDINQEFEDLHLEERESSDTVDNLVLGFDDGVQVQLSSADFQNDSSREKRDFGLLEDSEHIGQDPGSRLDDCQIDIESPSGNACESGKAIMEPIQPTTDINTASKYGLLSQKTVSGATEAISSPTTPATAITSTQADLPVTLQFGLFSSPSLIPSPVPAIQIGSIQMPLHLHPPAGPSLSTHFHPPQFPAFQFGQLTYTSPISQILPMPSKTRALVQPNMQVHHAQPAHYSTCQTAKQEKVKSHPNDAARSSCDSVLVNNFVEDDALIKTPDAEVPHVVDDKISPGLASNCKPEGQIGEPIQRPSRFISGAKKFGRMRNSQGTPTNNRGGRYAYAVKSSNMRTNFPTSGPLQDSGGFHGRPRRFVQRTEFRVRENGDKKEFIGHVSTNNSRLEMKVNYNVRTPDVFERSVFRQGNIYRKNRGDSDNLVADNSISQRTNPKNKTNLENGKQTSTKAVGSSYSMGENLKRNLSEEDLDAPMQNGVVRVFNQQGIEACSDEDDFIQVRSKRQMLNDRREQRQKQIKDKFPVTKPQKKSHTSKPRTAISSSVEKASVAVDAAGLTRLNAVSSKGNAIPNKDVTAGMLLVTPLPSSPIGAQAKPCEPQTDRKSDIKNRMVADVPSSMTSWGETQTTQQVLSLTQAQLKNATKVRLDTHIASIGSHSSTIAEATPSSSAMTKDKFYSSAVSPINSLLAGEKIQFGAVTSSSIIPFSSGPASHGIGISGSTTADIQILQKNSATERDSFFGRDKNTNSCILHDRDAEAEAAASAVAVAAIGCDETVGSRIGSVSDANFFGGGDVVETSAVLAGDQKLSNHSRGEDSLTVSLPADLSVETSAISMWPTLPSPLSSTSQVLSQFSGGPPSHFPFYEMNPMLGRPVFALQHENPTTSQSQPQIDNPSISGPFSSWQHSAMDSFYGHPEGYPGPFISPPGGIAAVQPPPHMVVYNHFAPVGQFGQVGLSFMGTTYIPTGKQPDWKHNPTSSAMGISEGETNSINMASSQHSNSNVASTIQRLSSGSPLMPVAPPLTMFDVSPFQSPEVSAQAHWSTVPASPLNSISASWGLHQQVDGILPTQFSHARPDDQSLNANKFHDTETSLSRNQPRLSIVEGASVMPFSNQLGSVDASLPTTMVTSSQSSFSQSSSKNTAVQDSDKSDGIRNVVGNNSANANFRSPSSFQHKNASASQGHSAGNIYQRGAAMSQKNTSGSEWSQRRMGYNSRNQSQGAEKGFPAAKVKQIYVPKQTMGDTPSAG